MGQDLTGKLIKNTYEDLVQISGSILTDGTGSDINNLTVTASNATTATSASQAEVANRVYATGSSDFSAYSVLLGETGFIGDGDTPIIVENGGNLAYNPAVSTLYSPIFSGTLNGNADTATSASYATTASYAESSSADNITLQQVTDNGNTTDNFISSSAGFIRKTTSSNQAYIQLGDLQQNPSNVYFESERNGVDQIRFTSSELTNAILLNQSGSQNVRLDFNNCAGEIESEGDLTLDTRGLGDVIIPSGSLVMANSNEILSDTYKPSGSQAIYYTNNDLGNPTGLNESGLVLTGSASIDVDGANNILLTSTKDTFKVPVEFEQDVTGSNATFTNVTVGTISGSTALFTSASIGYLTAVTGSVTKIGDAFILLNTSDVTRYAGLLVEDSGSATPINYTASFFFDSDTNDWNYEYTSGSTDYGVALFGPTYSTKGVPTYLTANTLPKAEGTHHLVDSIISDDGSVVTVSGNVEATAITASAGFSGDLAGTASFATTASYATNALSASYSVTASYAENAAGVPLALFTASISDATITFTKGDASTFPITVNNVNNAISASFATTASFALSSSADILTLQDVTDNGAVTTNLVNLQGGIVVSGSALISGSLGTGGFIDNVGTPTASAAIEHLVYISQSEYNALTPNDNTMYVITSDTGATILTDTVVSGSLLGYVNSLTIASTTASMDCSLGNFFTLQLVAGADTRIEPSNIAAGQTINVRVNTTGSGTVSFPSTVKQVSGASYVPTTSTGVDVITFISFDSSALYLSNVKNLV